MPNDAKLGLLAGVIGVVVAASLMLSRPPSGAPPPGPAAGANPKPGADGQASPAPAAFAVPTDYQIATPVARTKRETDATPASRKPGNDDIEP